MPSGMRPTIDILLAQQHRSTASIPRLQPTFSWRHRWATAPSNRSTGSKQTLNGLFICN